MKRKIEVMELKPDRNMDSVKCKCGFRNLFNKNMVEQNEQGQRVIYCSRCHREVVLRKK